MQHKIHKLFNCSKVNINMFMFVWPRRYHALVILKNEKSEKANRKNESEISLAESLMITLYKSLSPFYRYTG